MNFQDALTNLQAGKQVLRTGWKDKDRHVLLFVRPEKYQGYLRDGVLYRNDQTQVAQYTRIYRCYNPTVNDILATDWELAK